MSTCESLPTVDTVFSLFPIICLVQLVTFGRMAKLTVGRHQEFIGCREWVYEGNWSTCGGTISLLPSSSRQFTY